METLAATPITPDRPSPPTRSSTSPTFPSNVDPESQSRRGSRTFKSPGLPRRASTFSTLTPSITEEKVSTPPRATWASASSEQTSPEIERIPTILPEEDALHGYPKLASFISREPGARIFKRFASLNARNLLYHQTKVLHLEHEFDELEKAHKANKDLHYTIDNLFSAQEGMPGYDLRLKWEEVSEALEKYNRLLIDQKAMHELPEPEGHFVDSLHNFVTNEKLPDPYWMQHPDNMVYAVWDDDRKPVQKDLVTLDYDLRARDPFTKFFTGTLLDWWHPFYERFKVSILCAQT